MAYNKMAKKDEAQQKKYDALNKKVDQTLVGSKEAKDRSEVEELRQRFKDVTSDVNRVYSYSRTHDNLIDQFNSLARRGKAKDKAAFEGAVKNELNGNIVSAIETRDANILNDFYHGSKSRFSNYNTYRQIFGLIPQLSRIAQTVADNIVSPDDFSQMSIYSALDTKFSELKEHTIIDENLAELYEKYKIEDKVRKYVLETVYTGDCFVAVLNYQKEFKKVLAENTNITETEMFKSVVSESVNGLLNECETYVTEMSHAHIDYTDLKLGSEFTEEHTKEINDYINHKFAFVSDYKSVLLQESNEVMMSEADDSNVSRFNGSIVRFLEPEKVVKIAIGDTTLGYYYLERARDANFGKNLSTTNPIFGSSIGASANTGLNTMRMSGQNQDTAMDPIEYLTGIVMSRMSKKINKKHLASNPEFKDAMYHILRTDFLKKDARRDDPVLVTFIPAEECIHFMEGEGDYGTSLFSNIVFTAKIYLTSLVSTLMQRLIRSPDKRVFTVDVGLDEDYEGAVMTFMRDLKSKDITINSLTGDIDTALQQVSAFKDIVIPAMDGKRPIEVDSFPGADVSIDNDFLDYLLKSMMSGTGVPRAMIDDAENVEFSRTLAMQNGNFVRLICAYQTMFERRFTDFIRLLYRNEFDINKEEHPYDVEDIKTYLSSPAYIKIASTSEIIGQVQVIADGLTNLFFEDPTMNPPDSEANPDESLTAVIERREFKKYLYKKHMPQVDWDELEKFKIDARAAATKEHLHKNAYKDPKEDTPTPNDFTPQ